MKYNIDTKIERIIVGIITRLRALNLEGDTLIQRAYIDQVKKLKSIGKTIISAKGKGEIYTNKIIVKEESIKPPNTAQITLNAPIFLASISGVERDL